MFILLIQSILCESNMTTEEAVSKLTEDAKIVLYSVFGTTGCSIIVGIVLKCFGCCSSCCSKTNNEKDETFHV